MLRTGLVIDSRYQDHDTGFGHPERPDRITALLDGVEDADAPHVHRVEPRSATDEELERVHDGSHVARVAASAEHHRFAFDADTPVCPASHDIARLAAGGLLGLVDHIMDGSADNGFAMVRPPGHHAEADRAMGFCLFNNVAVAARHLQHRHGLNRVMIVDWDVHHGNGTQHIFEDDPGVLFLSLHQYPFYPGTGGLHEVGRGPGEGFTVNLPLPGGCGDDEYMAAFERVVVPICHQFEPELVLISAGFDAHVRDPLAGMRVSDEGFAAMARSLLRAVAEVADNRCAAVLEGGYDLEALAGSALGVLAAMSGEDLAEPSASTSAVATVDQMFGTHGRYWDL